MIWIGLDYNKCLNKIPFEHKKLRSFFKFSILIHIILFFTVLYSVYFDYFSRYFYTYPFYIIIISTFIAMIAVKQLIIKGINNIKTLQIKPKSQIKIQKNRSLSKFIDSISNTVETQKQKEAKALLITDFCLYFMWIVIILIVLNIIRLVTKKNLPEKWRLNKFATVSLIFIFVFGVLPVIFFAIPWVYWTIR